MSPNFSCLVSCRARWPMCRVIRNHIVRVITSGSWTPNWFCSTSSFVRATVALGWFPFPCLRSSRLFYFKTSLDILNSSDFRMFSLFVVFAVQVALDATREGRNCVGFVFSFVFLSNCYVEVAGWFVQLGRGKT